MRIVRAYYSAVIQFGYGKEDQPFNAAKPASRETAMLEIVETGGKWFKIQDRLIEPMPVEKHLPASVGSGRKKLRGQIAEEEVLQKLVKEVVLMRRLSAPLEIALQSNGPRKSINLPTPTVRVRAVAEPLALKANLLLERGLAHLGVLVGVPAEVRRHRFASPQEVKLLVVGPHLVPGLLLLLLAKPAHRAEAEVE